MFEPNLSIDVSLLAIILGLHAMKNDRNLILLLICILFAHVLLTSEDEWGAGDDRLMSDGPTLEQTSDATSDAVAHDGLMGAAAPNADAAVTTTTTTTPAAATAVTETKNTLATDGFQGTLSSGVFGRQLSTPQTNFTSTVLPATSAEANGKLASARGSFFESLVS
ncbi:unnamed protein product [Ectocarpus sp. 12 AP-2014]